MVKTLLWSFMLLAAGGGAASVYWKTRPAAPEDSHLVGLGTVHRQVRGWGKIEGLSEAKINSPRAGMIESVLVTEGQEVEDKFILAEMNSLELDKKIEEADSLLKEKTAEVELAQMSRTPEAIEQAIEKLRQAKEDAKGESARLQGLKDPEPPPPATLAQITDADFAIERARQNRVLADVALKALQARPNVTEKNVADEKVKMAESDLASAQKQLQRHSDFIIPLPGNNGPTKLQLDAAYQNALRKLELAKAERDQVYRGPSAFEIEGAIANLALSTIELDSTEAAKKRLLNPEPLRLPSQQEMRLAEAAVLHAEARVRQAEAALKELQRPPAKAEIDKADAAREGVQTALALLKLHREGLKLRAPFAGLVTLRHQEPGSIVNAFVPVITMIDFSEKKVRAEFSVNRLPDVKAGMQVEIRVLKDILVGKVEKIGRVGPRTLFSDDKSEPTGGQVFQVFISIEEPKDEIKLELYKALRPDLRVDAVVTIEKRENVITVPKTFVSRRDGQEFVWMVENGDSSPNAIPRQHPVETGLFDDLSVEIKKGLNAGDRITRPRAQSR